MPGVPGRGNLPGTGKKAKGRAAAPPRRGKARSGNPAKRAEQLRGTDVKPSAPAGSAFGLGATQPAATPDLQLPEGLDRYLRGR